MCICKRIVAVFFVLIVCSFQSIGQIVNIERARMQSDTIGWLGSAGATFSLNKNTIQVFASDLDAHLQYKSKRSLYLGLVNYGFLKGGDEKLIDYAFLHLRYNYKINKLVRWEVFTQLQNNIVTRIDSRFLIGTGPRLKILSNKLIRIYAASLIMYEKEKESKSALVHQDMRNSSYLSMTITPNPLVEIISTSFFQPLLKQLSDYRLLNQTSIRVKASKRVGIKVNWNYLNDSFPAEGIPSVNYTLSTGFDFDF